MAQDFERYGLNAVGTSATDVHTSNSDDAIIGIRVANVVTQTIAVDVYISSGGSDYYLAKNVSIPQGSSMEFMKKSGYVSQSIAVESALQVGFKLVATSEINANPKDTADHPKGVWTLPPSFRLQNVDKSKYQDIGESDRMTLLFIK